jgi:integrase
LEKPEDVGRLLAEIRRIGEEDKRPSLYPLVAFLAYSGARKGEALGLHWHDVDLASQLVAIRYSYKGTTKSGRHRTVPISPELVRILEEHKLADPWQGAWLSRVENDNCSAPILRPTAFISN